MSFGLQHVGKKRKKGMTTTELENIQNDQPLRQRTKNDCLENKSRIPFTVSTFSATSRPVLALRSGCGKPPLLSNTVFVVPALITLKGLYKHPTFYTSPSVATEITLFAYKQIFGKTSLTTTTVTSVPSSSASTIPPLSSSSTPVKLITMYEHNKKTSNKPLSHSKPSHSATTAPLKRTETTMGAATKRLYEPTPIEQLLSNNSHPKFLPTSVPVKKIKMCGNPPPTDKLSMNDVNKSTHLSTASAIKTVPMTDNSMKHTPKASLSAPTMITTTTTTAAAAAAAAKTDTFPVQSHVSAITATSSCTLPVQHHKKLKRIFKPVIGQKKRKNSKKRVSSALDKPSSSSSFRSIHSNRNPESLRTTDFSTSIENAHVGNNAKEHFYHDDPADDDEEEVPMTKPLTITEKRRRQAARANQLKVWRVREEREARAARLLSRKQILASPSNANTTSKKDKSKPMTDDNNHHSPLRKKKKRVRFNLEKNVIHIPNPTITTTATTTTTTTTTTTMNDE